MSVFISYNYKTGLKSAKLVEKKLKAQGLDAWWFPGKLNDNQLDAQVSLAIDNCSRCILLWTNHPMSDWQTRETIKLEQKFAERSQSKMAAEYFIILRENKVLKESRERGVHNATLPFFKGCEYIDYSADDPKTLIIDFLDSTPPGQIPVTCGGGVKPMIVMPGDFKPASGNFSIRGNFVSYDGPSKARHCWVFLRDNEGKRKAARYYIQQPRPTITHKKRWAASNVCIGEKITGIVLAAVEDNVHRQIVKLVLKQKYGAIENAKIIDSMEILDEITFKPVK